MGTRLRTRLGPVFSEGARLAWLALASRGWSPADLAGKLRTDEDRPVERGTVHGWLYGDRSPTIFYLAQIETLLGIASALWAQEPSVEFAFPEAA